MVGMVSRALLLVLGVALSTPVQAATWETVSQDSQEFWVPDVVSTRSIVVTEPVHDWVAEEAWHPVTVLTATAAVVIQRIPASQVESVLGPAKKAAAGSSLIGVFQGQRTTGAANLTGLKARSAIGADSGKVSNSRSSASGGASTIRNQNGDRQ